jgi:two-component system NtrC family sensor kinase
MSALGRMISGVAHELNNPLTSILGFTQLLLEDPSVDPTLADDLRRIHGEAQRCRSSVENMVKVARQEATSKEVLRLEDLLDETLAIREYELGVHNVIIEREYGRDLPPVLANHDQIQQVILAIVGNAYDAMRDAGRGGQVRVRGWTEHGKVFVEFLDPGTGIADPERVFDPFYTTKEVGKGMGLGLSLAYGIMQEHGGRVTAANRTDGQGARFLLEFPAADGLVAKPSEDARAGMPRRVLVVDDEPGVLELCRRLLVREGLEVVTAADGREALRRLGESDFDLIFTDIRMPGGIHGLDLYHWVTRNRKHLEKRVVLATGDAADPETRRILKTTGLPCVLKPFDLKEFVATVHRVLAQADAADGAASGGAAAVAPPGQVSEQPGPPPPSDATRR